MTIPRRHFLQLAAVATLLPSPKMARADDYPSRPITVIVPFSAGGPLDITGRMIAAKMQQTLGQPIVIENVGGAGGSIGVGRGARAAPDGYTLTMGIWSTHVVNPVLYDLNYDVEKDFEPIAPITDGPLVICARKDFPANDLTELIAWLKANPDKATSSDAGVGSPQHVFSVLFQQVTGTRFQFVHYRGGGQAMQDLVTGHVDLSFSDAISALTQVQGGTIKTYAVMSKNRLPGAPQIPSVDEAGLPGFYDSVWSGIWAPKGTPKAIINKLNAAVVAAVDDPTIRTRLTALGRVLFPREQMTPQALAALQRAEIEKWWPIIKAAGIRGE